MPRLSIIVPFRGNADALEKTLVSVLSNRPADSEVILSHDGSYTDPYSISDEVIFVETPRASQGRPRPSMVRLINEAILAATAPVIHVLADGCIVSEGWADSPVEVFQDQNVGAVAAILCDTKSAEPHSVGLRCQGMPQSVELAGVRSAARERLRIDGPTMNAGFFRRRVLLALNGFLEAAEQNADVDFALAIRDLELRCVADWNCKIACSSEMLLEPSGYGHGQSLGNLVAAYAGNSSASPSWVDLVGNCLKPARLTTLLGFRAGCRSNRLQSVCQDRISQAQHQLGSAPSTIPMTRFPGESNIRGAAVRKAA